MTGLFITFEGIDGAGKSSHLEATREWLQARGHEVQGTREPGGTPLAELLREAVLHRPMDALTEALLVFAARRDHLTRVVEPALQRGITVLCDRFTDATFAYQGGGRGFDLGVLRQLEAWVQEGRQPDLTVWFDLPAEEAAVRRAAARSPDRFEQQGADFFERVRSGYQARADEQPRRYARVDARGDRATVWARVQRVLEARCVDRR